jgi:ABC-2 type transport system ATP-binding protein
VDDVSFTVGASECYGLLGPNGTGKTTTIALVCELLRPDGGEVTVDGELGGSLAAKAAIGCVPQELALYPDLSARENLRFFGQLYAMGGKRLERRIDETLDLVGLADRGRDRISSYSGGMKRRANIAAGLLHAPRLLILDEPTVGVDPQSRNAILETVGGLGIAAGWPSGATPMRCGSGSDDAGTAAQDVTNDTTTRARSSPQSSWRKCPPPSMVVCGWPCAPAIWDCSTR